MDLRKMRIIIGLLSIALILTGVWGYNQYREKMEYRVYLQNQFMRQFYDVVDEVENVQVNLGKSIVAGTPRQKVMLFSDIRQQSFAAQEKINQLPISHLALNKTSKFLAQVGDYCNSLFDKNLKGKPVTTDDMENLEKLHNNAANLTVELQKLFGKMREGGIKLGELRRQGYYAMEKEGQMDGEFQEIQKKVENYPRLIYDGPFSEHVGNIEPRGLKGDRITSEKAKDVAEKFLYDKNIKNIEMISSGQGNIKTYGLKVNLNNKENPVYIDVSRKGGHVVWMLNGRPITATGVSLDQALKRALEFLKRNGYDNMVSTYSIRSDNSIIYNFVYQQDDVMIYPDMVKVRVALDTGEIVGFDARQYLTSHYNRNIPDPKITEEQARELISMRFEPKDGKLAIIPLPGKREALCYEFKGSFQGDTFIVYINALTGVEEDILQIIEDQTGKFTM